jgi:hypothetical protein
MGGILVRSRKAKRKFRSKALSSGFWQFVYLIDQTTVIQTRTLSVRVLALGRALPRGSIVCTRKPTFPSGLSA